MTPLDHAVGLLDRALCYTGATLNDVTDADLGRRTPCERWDLGQLLAHMDDALDAFAEGARGEVELQDRVPARVRVRRLQQKACALLVAWTPQTPHPVRIGGHELATEVVVGAAALEITVHGWDVTQAVGTARPIPGALARGLLPIAESLVAEAERGSEFGAPRPVPSESADEIRLLGFLGRDAYPRMSVTGSQVQITRNRHTGGAAGS